MVAFRISIRVGGGGGGSGIPGGKYPARGRRGMLALPSPPAGYKREFCSEQIV